MQCRTGIFSTQEMGPADPRFEYLVDHKEAFDRTVGQKIVDEKIYSVYGDELLGINNSKDAEWPERIGRIAHQIQKIGFEKKSEIENTLDYVVAYLSKDIEGVLKNLEERN